MQKHCTKGEMESHLWLRKCHLECNFLVTDKRHFRESLKTVLGFQSRILRLIRARS